MRALIVMPLAEQRGGAELVLHQLMQDGSGQGIEWSVVFLEEGPMVEEFRDLGVDVAVVHAGRLRHFHRYVGTVVRIRSIARQWRADLVFSWMTKGHLYGGIAAYTMRLPSLCYQWGIPTRGSWLDRVATVLPSRGMIATSRTAEAAQSLLRPRREQRVVYPGVDLHRFDPELLPKQDDVRRTLGLPVDDRIIGFFGRLQRWKGAHLLIEAMPRVLEAFPNTRCVVVGGAHDLEPDYTDHLLERISALGLQERAILAGFQSDIPGWMHAMDVIALPSNNEPFGITVIEAMALRKPVVAGLLGGHAEIITAGVDGLLVRTDATAVAEAILHYLEHPELCRSMGKHARERARQFTTQRYAAELVSAVRELGAG